MKRYMGLLLLTAALAGQGCVGMEKMFWEHDVAEPKEQIKAKAPPPLAPVTAVGVTEATAAQTAEALAAELDRAASEAVGQPK